VPFDAVVGELAIAPSYAVAMHTAQPSTGPVPPVNVRNLDGELVDVDLRGVTRVKELRDCIAELKEVLPSEVKLLSKDKDLSDSFVLRELLGRPQVVTTNGFLDIQVVITKTNQTSIENSLARRHGSQSYGHMANLTKLEYPFVVPDTMQDMMRVGQNPELGEEMTQLPENIGDMTGLETLVMTGHALRHLPQRVGELSNLTLLKLGRNELRRLPDSIGCLVKLRELELHQNKLSILPDSFGSLVRLQRLNLESNNLGGLPATFPKLRGLQNLNLKNNPLQSLPEGFERLSIKWFDFDVNIESFQNDQRVEFVRHLPFHIQRLPAFDPYRERTPCFPCCRRAKKEVDRAADQDVESQGVRGSLCSTAEDQAILMRCVSAQSHPQEVEKDVVVEDLAVPHQILTPAPDPAPAIRGKTHV